MAEEMLTVYNDQMEPVGVAPRSQAHAQAHAQGLRHLVAHCWVISPREDGVWIWFQKRAKDKADFPGYYDIAVGGHIAHREEPEEAILREIREEIGLCLQKEDLIDLGLWREDLWEKEETLDREAARAFLYLCPHPVFAPGEEVEEMAAVPLEQWQRKELEGSEWVEALRQGQREQIRADRWCRHPEEFPRLILPFLRERGLCW